MNVLVVGGGGREHALVWKIAQSPRVERIFCAPGNAGIAEQAEIVPLTVEDLEGLADFAENQGVDLTVVGPEGPLLAGIVDVFEQRGLKIYGPNARAATIEGSKVFAKQLFARHGIPTASFEVFDDPNEASDYVRRRGAPIVVKADGNALGKGAIVCEDVDTALRAIDDMMVKRVFGDAGARVVIEERLVGREMSIKVFTDGEAIVPMAPARDYKRALDNDEGLNTGGMGCYSPVPHVSPPVLNEAIEKIIRPTVDALREEGIRYKGTLYGGLILTDSGLHVLEFNCRFGDPEAQVVFPRLESDLVDILEAVVEERLAEADVHWSPRAAVCVVMASAGYPGSYEKGKPIYGLDAVAQMPDTFVFHAGTARRDGTIVTNGGRVLGVTAWADTLAGARARAYEAVGKISFEGAHFRRDIAQEG